MSISFKVDNKLFEFSIKKVAYSGYLTAMAEIGNVCRLVCPINLDVPLSDMKIIHNLLIYNKVPHGAPGL